MGLMTAHAQNDELLIITYGDSITAGLIRTIDDNESAECPPGVALQPSISGSGNLRCFGNGAEGVGGYQPILRSSLEEIGYDVSIYNYGISGANVVTDLLDDVNSVLAQRELSQYVLFMGGINDAFDGISPSTVELFYEATVERICLFEMIPVITSVTRHLSNGAVNDMAREYTDEIEQIGTPDACANRGIDVLLADQREVVNSGADYGPDGLHLTERGNEDMAEEWFRVLDLPSLIEPEPEPEPDFSYLPAIISLLLGN